MKPRVHSKANCHAQFKIKSPCAENAGSRGQQTKLNSYYPVVIDANSRDSELSGERGGGHSEGAPSHFQGNSRTQVWEGGEGVAVFFLKAVLPIITYCLIDLLAKAWKTIGVFLSKKLLKQNH